VARTAPASGTALPALVTGTTPPVNSHAPLRVSLDAAVWSYGVFITANAGGTGPPEKGATMARKTTITSTTLEASTATAAKRPKLVNDGKPREKGKARP
jgi:hypothetical protein